jgi:type IV pilus assembly protein PilB
MQPARLRLGQLLIEAHIVSPEQLEQVLALQKTDGRRLGTLLVESGLITETQLTQILSQQLSVPWVSLYHIDFSRDLLSRVPRDVAEKYCLVPIYVRPVRGQGDTLYVAMEDPMNDEALRQCSGSAGLPARPMIAAPSAILKAIRLYYGGSSSPPAVVALPTEAPAATPVARAAIAPSSAVSLAGGSAVTSTLVSRSAVPAIENGTSNEITAVPPPVEGASAAQLVEAVAEDDAPALEVREIEIPKKRRRRAQMTLLDGTTIKMPSSPRGRSQPADGEPPSEQEVTAADMLAALRAAAHGADAAEILGTNVRWEKMMAALLSLLLRKHLILERELIEELRKI